MKLSCVGCGKTFPHGYHPFCDSCDAMMDVEYDLIRVRQVESANPYLRFRDLLPLAVAEPLPPDATYTPWIDDTIPVDLTARDREATRGGRTVWLERTGGDWSPENPDESGVQWRAASEADA